MGKNVIISTLPNISQNYLPKVNTSNIFANSLVYDDGDSVLINTTTASAFRLDVNGTGRFQGALTGTSATFNVGSATTVLGLTGNGNGATIASITNTDTGTAGRSSFQVTSDSATAHYFASSSTNVSTATGGRASTAGIFTASGDTAGGLAFLARNAAGYITFHTGGNTERVRIAANGAATFSNSVLIGNASASSSRFQLSFTNWNTTNSYPYITLTTPTGSNVAGIGINTSNDLVIGRTSGTNANFTNEDLKISNSTGAATFSSSVTAGGLLSVNGDASLVANFNYASNGTYVRWQNNGTSFGDIGSGSSLISGGSTNDFAIHARSTYNIVFATNFTERMRITSGGNVIIGNTTAYGGLTISDFTANDGNDSLSFFYKGTTGNHESLIKFYDFRGQVNAAIGNNLEDDGSGTQKARLVFKTSYNGTPTERMRITSGGLVGIGAAASNPLDNLHIAASEAGNVGISVQNTNASYSAQIRFLNSAGTEKAALTYVQSNDSLVIANNSQNVVTISSGGKVMVNTTDSGPNAYLFVSANSSQPYPLGAKGESTNQGLIGFFDNGNSVIGSISKSGSSVAYNTSSDYRLKEDLKDFNGLKLIESIKVFDFQWKSDKTRMYGVLAHQLYEIVPYLVFGVKDGEQMQGVDYSKITPILVKAIQEQQAQIEEQKADIESLKALINK